MSYRNDSSAGYDRTLLSSVPDPTRAEKQEGYNVDLLDEGRDRRVPTPPNDVPTSDHHGGSAMAYSPGAVGYARKEETAALNGHEPVVAKVPWYRTRRSMIIIAIAALVVIGAIVGGVVGGTHHKKSNKNTSGTNGNSGEQGTGSASQQQSAEVGATPNTSGSATSAAAASTPASASASASTSEAPGVNAAPNTATSSSRSSGPTPRRRALDDIL